MPVSKARSISLALRFTSAGLVPQTCFCVPSGSVMLRWERPSARFFIILNCTSKFWACFYSRSISIHVLKRERLILGIKMPGLLLLPGSGGTILLAWNIIVPPG